ncbi:MAG TPA: hypothetical protein VD699_01245 [Nitrosopumilaceae archaeon]|nr:hypothetical protein [Nitrosopumilaceae archaeon]
MELSDITVKKTITLFFAILLISVNIATFNFIPVFSEEIANVRGKDYQIVAYANGTNVATFGKEEWISSSTGYVPYIQNDNGTHIIIDNKQFPFAVSKNNCIVTVYDNKQRISDTTPIVIEKEWWNVGWKRTNGGQWEEIDFSTVPCTINPITNSSGIFIETTKSNIDGTLVVIYAKRIGQEFETFQNWTNQDSSRTNHIFKFIEKYDNIHGENILTDSTTITEDGIFTVSSSDISNSQIITLKNPAFSLFNLDISKAFNKFQSVTFNKTGTITDASFDYGKNAITLPVGSTQFLDPTFGYTTGKTYMVANNPTPGTSCETSFFVAGEGSNFKDISIPDSDLFERCHVVSPRWDISLIPDDATITDTDLRYDVSSVTSPFNCNFKEINNYPTTASGLTLWTDIQDGTEFVSNDSGCTTTGTDKLLDLGTNADLDVQTQLAHNWWSVGISPTSFTRDSTSSHTIDFGDGSFELQITYTGGTAPTGAFVDGSSNTGISTDCSSRTTLATLTTAFPSGTNVIFATIQAVSTNAGNKGVTVGLYEGTTLLAQNQFDVQVGGASKGNTYTLLKVMEGTTSNPTYTVQACTSGTAVNAEAKILAVNGLTYARFTDSGSTALGTADTTIATNSTNFPPGNNVVIASIQVDNGAKDQDVAPGALIIKNNNGAAIASNQFAMSLKKGTPTDIQSILLVAKDDLAPANPTYTVTGKTPNASNAEAKLIILQPKSYAYSDGSPTAIDTVGVTVGELTSTFAETVDKAIIVGTEIIDGDPGIEIISANQFLFFSGNINAQVSVDNEYAIEAFGAAGNDGDGYRMPLLAKDAEEKASPTIEIRTAASATGLSGEAKILSFEIANP